MSAEPLILVLNCGSSSLKFALFQKSDHRCMGQGSIVGIGTKPVLSAKGELFSAAGKFEMQGVCSSTTEATEQLVTYLESVLPAGTIVGVGHRVVHGGEMTKHVLLTPDMIAYLNSIYPLAPLHQPYNMASVEVILKRHPELPQVACLDTTFHATIPPMHSQLAIPRAWSAKGIRRYGFHGLSYEYISSRLEKAMPKAFTGNTVVAHLGNGASMCAMKGGKSWESTMGFSALEGLMMGTRPGHIDPGALLYFLKEAKMTPDQLEKMLYRESGLLGVSGITNDMAELLASPAPEAREAINLFCHRARREAGALISVLDGFDALVFTGGMGENAPAIRAQICDGLKWAGVKLDLEKNQAAVRKGEQLISTPGSAVDVWVIPTDEESVIVRHTCKLAFPA